MKKLLISAFAILSAFCILSCGSTPASEDVISEVSANHITVSQSQSKVTVILNRSAEENISAITVSDALNESSVTVPMPQEKVSFIWPFAESGKEYMLCADLLDDKNTSTAKEFVSFKVEGEPSVCTNTDAFDKATLVLVAKGNERTVRFNSSQEDIKTVTSAFKTTAANLKIQIYSGKHYNSDISQASLVATLTKPVLNKEDLQQVFDGYDLISNAKAFNLTPSKMNAALSQNKTYFAVATVEFSLPETSDLKFNSKTLYSNDTIYTPVSASELSKIESAIDNYGDK